MLPAISVSSREAEVLAGVGERLTNAEIGARLFISTRTVESHVSSLLRKYQVTDRRALATAAIVSPPTEPRPASEPRGTNSPLPSLPLPLTSFVGRVAERAALADALMRHRLVTALGPGGVGKTRLALSVAGEVAERFDDGVWFVDLARVTDPAAVPAAIAAALGVVECQDQSDEDNVLCWLQDREALLVLDNCEQILSGVGPIVEQLLAGSRRLRILATSRARLVVPFEWVFAVPGLSLDADDGGPGDAVRLFLERAAAGASPSTSDDTERLAAICRALDGVALAIELAAARYPSLGIDGLEAGLADRLRLLTGGRRADERHRSLRSTLDWSYTLLDASDAAVLRRIAVFATPFTTEAADVLVADWEPAPVGAVQSALARLADQSLLVPIADPGGTRYHAAETIRQYGIEKLTKAGELQDARFRHLHWCLERCAVLMATRSDATGRWRESFDAVVDEVRATLREAAGTPGHRRLAHRLALELAELSFSRGMPGEAQRRYEQAAALTDDDAAAATALRLAAGAAETRYFGNHALRLHRASAAAATRAGDPVSAAVALARTAELIGRGPGLMAWAPAEGDPAALIMQARSMVADSSLVEARTLIAEAFVRGDDGELAERGLAIAARNNDKIGQSAALDQLTSLWLARGDVRTAAATAMRRTELLASMPVTAMSGFEISDAFSMAAECAIAAGDLRAARRLAEQVRDLPFNREEGHLATARLIVVAVLEGNWDEAVALADRFRRGWERAGRPRTGNLARGAYAAATAHGLRGDDEARADWLGIVASLASPVGPGWQIPFKFFDALLLLHRGRAEDAVRRLDSPPDHFRTWFTGMWRPWYAAVWAEAAVLARTRDAGERIKRARLATLDNPIASAIVNRAAALHDDCRGMVQVATALQSAGSPYQLARTVALCTTAVRERPAVAALS